MTNAEELPSVLIISATRGDRRGLFNALDQHGEFAAYPVADIEQARQSLSERDDIVAVFLDLGLRTEDLAIFCREVADKLAIPVIGIIPGVMDEETETAWDWENLPVGVVECLQSPVQPEEAIYRLHRVLSGSPQVSGGKAPRQGAYDPIFELIQDGLVLLDTDSLEIVDVNPALTKRSRFTREELIGKPFLELDLTHDEDQRSELREALKRDGRLRFRCRLETQSGGWFPVEVNLQLASFGDQMCYLADLHDLSAQQQTDRALDLIASSFDTQLEGKQLSRLAAQAVTWLGADYFLIATQTTEGHGLEVQALYCRNGIKDNLEASVAGGLLRRILHGDTINFREGAWRDTKVNDSFLVENSIESYVGIPLVENTKEVSGVLIAASRSLISQWPLACSTLQILANRFAIELQAKRFYKDTRSQGLRDNLTHLPNRLLFEDRLHSSLKEAQRTGEMFSVMFVDLDRFKTINDSFGHDVGDQVLRGVARRLSSAIRASDTVARYAGDEFTLVLRHIIQREDVFRVARKLNQVLGEPLQLPEGKEISCTASIGVSFYPDDGTTGAELVKHADQAMYNAKGLGRNTYQSYVNIPEESQQQKLLLEAKLRKARQNKELRVYYQPQVATDSEDIIGMEALIRWQHPELGLISPGFFIPLAEETGLIVPMGEWVLNVACRQAREWRDRFGLQLRLGVNLSALQLKQPGIVEIIKQALKKSDLPAQALDLEVTESISLKEVTNLLDTLERIRDIGCSISIDDFGTGQSSLDYIKRFPAERIKIDQTFVRNIGVDPDDAAIVEATITMAHNLNRLVVAEGVEEEQQLEFLKKHHCEEVQGYLFCRPLPAQAFERLLVERERLIGAQETA